ncbi:MAG TPA: ADOP family duplicated permease [Gemmatimonadaceae bacterium]|jgi:predicted permease
MLTDHLSRVARDLRHAGRRLSRRPAFAISAALTLALGIGGATAAFTVVNAVLLRGLPYPDAERLVDFSHSITLGGNTTHIDVSDATYLLYRRDQRVFDDIGVYRSTAVNLVASPSTNASTARVGSVELTPSVLRVLQVVPTRGRGLIESDGEPNATPVVAISYGLWQSVFGADSQIIGRRVVVDGVEHEVVGVMPRRFDFPGGRAGLWTPLRLDPARTKSAAFDYRGIARLRHGVSATVAASELQRLLPRVPEAFPGRLTSAGITMTHMQAFARPLRDVVTGDATRSLWIVAGAIGALLALVFANVANLFLARAEGRRHETAVRRALGASSGALFSDLSAESIVVASVGGVGGLALAIESVRVLQAMSFASSIPRLDEVRVDAAAVAFAVAASAIAALLAGWLPSIRSGRASVATVLAAEGQRASGDRQRHRARHTLIVAQLALALVLLAAAGLFARGFGRLRNVNPGFDAHGAVAFRLALPDVTYPSATDAASTIARTMESLRAVPGVAIVGAITKLPLDDQAHQDSAVFVEDHPLGMGVLPNLHSMAFASPEYFAAMRIPVIAGRLFASLDPSADTAHTAREVVVSAAFARRYWTPDVAVGKQIKMNGAGAWSTIVGVVGDVRDQGLTEAPVEMVYSPLLTTAASGKQWTPHDVAFVVRTSDGRELPAMNVESAVRSAAPGVPVYRMIPLGALRESASARTSFLLAVLAVAALLALVIGGVGLYGVTAYLVGLRTREIGVRMALGAQSSDVRRLVLGGAVRDAGIGVVFGLVGALLIGRTIAATLYGVAPVDPAMLLAASLLLLGTSLLATWVPARRASRLDPASTLRSSS